MMQKQAMTEARLFELIAAYGAEPQDWPADERAAAEAHLMANPQVFAAALQEAESLDQALAGLAMPEPGSDLAHRILASAPVPHAHASSGLWQRVSAALFPQGMRWPAGAALASLAMGLVGGYAYAGSAPVYNEADSAYLTIFADTETPAWLLNESGS